MPPHRLFRLSPYITPQNFWRGAKSLLLLSSLVLAGCATNSQNQHADSSMLIRAERDHYLAQTQSDPLGAYLANREQSYAHGTSAKSTSALASTALSVLGIKYRYGGETPDTGFDCRSEEHTSELQSLMRISYAVSCLKKKNYRNT